VIKRAKKERAVVLTTHAMEEAEELCDRLGIFVDGSLRCVGNPKELTSRYGGFLVLTLTTTALRVAEAEAFVRKMSPGAQRTSALGGTLKFDLPLTEVNLASVFAAVSERKAELGILDWGVSNMVRSSGAPGRHSHAHTDACAARAAIQDAGGGVHQAGA